MHHVASALLTSHSIIARSTTTIALMLATAAAALWLWTNFCGFPWSPWNDVRLAPVFMAANGVDVYPAPDIGIVSTWMYGPVPLWLWWPATLAHDVVSAVLTAGVLNLAYTLGAILVVCWWWPVLGATRGVRLLAFAGCVALWPHSSFHYLQADNLAVAFGLIGNVALICQGGRTRGARGWAIALTTALALGSKQTSLGILAAQTAWLWSEHGRTHALHHLVRTLTAGAALAAIALRQFGFDGLWFGLIQIPGSLPWTGQPALRIWDLLPILLIQIGAPSLALLASRLRSLRRGHALRLPFFAWIASLPLGIPAMMTVGGTINSFQGFVLLLPPVLLVLGTAALRRRGWFPAAAMLSLALIGTRWVAQPNRPLVPATTALIQADQISRLYPEKIWFPWNPTVTYFSDGRFYHAEDGIYVRILTGHRLSWRQLEQGLPSDIQYVALLGSNWGIAKSFTRGPSFEQHLGYWELWRWKEP